MKFEWDYKKEAINIKKHGISFEIAQNIFNDPFQLTIPDILHSNDEERWITVGLVDKNLIVTVCHTYRDKYGEELMRIISARKATPKERREYHRR